MRRLAGSLAQRAEKNEDPDVCCAMLYYIEKYETRSARPRVSNRPVPIAKPPALLWRIGIVPLESFSGTTVSWFSRSNQIRRPHHHGRHYCRRRLVPSALQ